MNWLVISFKLEKAKLAILGASVSLTFFGAGILENLFLKAPQHSFGVVTICHFLLLTPSLLLFCPPYSLPPSPSWVKRYSRVGSSLNLCWPVGCSNTPPCWRRTPYIWASARPAHRPRSSSQSTKLLPWNTPRWWDWGQTWRWGRFRMWACCFRRSVLAGSWSWSVLVMCVWGSISHCVWHLEGRELLPRDLISSWDWWIWCTFRGSWLNCSWTWWVWILWRLGRCPEETSWCRGRCQGWRGWGWLSWPRLTAPFSSRSPPNLSLSEEGFTCRSAHAVPRATRGWQRGEREEWRDEG